MKLYNALVRLGGSISNEVHKEKLTAAEIAVLQRMHGPDAVVNVVEVGSVKNRSHARERARLAALYPKGPTLDGKGRLEGEAFIASIFGVPGQALPEAYEPHPIVDEEEVEQLTAQEEPETIVELEAPIKIKRTRVPKPAAVEPTAELIA